MARAGRSGIAYSLVSVDEMPSLVDLHLFLGRPVKLIPQDGLPRIEDWDGYFGRVSQSVIDDGSSALQLWHQESVELHNMIKVYTSAYKQYKRSCPAPSHESVKKAKEIKLELLGPHPVFVSESSELESDRLNLLEKMKSYRPHHVSTIYLHQNLLGILLELSLNSLFENDYGRQYLKLELQQILLRPK